MCVCVCACMCTYVCASVLVCLCACVHACMCVHARVYVYVCVCVHVCVCAYACVRVRVCVSNVNMAEASGFGSLPVKMRSSPTSGAHRQPPYPVPAIRPPFEAHPFFHRVCVNPDCPYQYTHTHTHSHTHTHTQKLLLCSQKLLHIL